MKKQIRRLWNWIPCCSMVRRLTGITLTIRGSLYLCNFVGSSAVIPYKSWEAVEIDNWTLGLVLIVSGLVLLATESRRLKILGRSAAILSLTIVAFLAGGVIHDSYIQFSTYAIMAVALVKEAAAVLHIDTTGSQYDSK